MAWRWHGYAAWCSHWIGWIFYLRPGIFFKYIFYIGLIFRDTPFFLSPVLVAQNKIWSCFPDSSPYLRHAHVAGFGIQGPKPKPLRPKPPGPKPPGPKPSVDPSWLPVFLRGQGPIVHIGTWDQELLDHAIFADLREQEEVTPWKGWAWWKCCRCISKMHGVYDS